MWEGRDVAKSWIRFESSARSGCQTLIFSVSITMVWISKVGHFEKGLIPFETVSESVERQVPFLRVPLNQVDWNIIYSLKLCSDEDVAGNVPYN